MFNKTRLKLTAWYLVIIMFISLSFSTVIYKVLTQEVERFARVQQLRIERRFHSNNLFYQDLPSDSSPPVIIVDIDLVKEIKQRIIIFLALVNGTILIFSGGLGYFLAGKTLKPIKDMIEEQNRFISDASHEFRTPLTSLKTAMEVSLRDKNLSIQSARILISESVNEVNKLQSLSDELLRLTQYHKSNVYLKFETLTTGEIVGRAVRKIEPLARLSQIRITNKAEDIKIEGNKYGLTDLMVILLDNAIKYSPKLTTVTISSKKTTGSVSLSVKDEGIGINKTDLSYIFDRFYRSDTARAKPKTGGYGLGLSIAKKIVDIHHGSISVKSQVKKGAIFTVILPVKQPLS